MRHSSKMSQKSYGEGRRARVKDFYITSDFNVELGVRSTDEDDNDELHGMYVP